MQFWKIFRTKLGKSLVGARLKNNHNKKMQSVLNKDKGGSVCLFAWIPQQRSKSLKVNIYVLTSWKVDFFVRDFCSLCINLKWFYKATFTIHDESSSVIIFNQKSTIIGHLQWALSRNKRLWNRNRHKKVSWFLLCLWKM